MKQKPIFLAISLALLSSAVLAEMLPAETSTTTKNNTATQKSEITGTNAAGERQVTVIDENGNLKMIEKSKVPTTTGKEPQSVQSMPPANSAATITPPTTSSGMLQSAPTPKPHPTAPAIAPSTVAPLSAAPNTNANMTTPPQTNTVPLSTPNMNPTMNMPAQPQTNTVPSTPNMNPNTNMPTQPQTNTVPLATPNRNLTPASQKPQ